MSRVRAAMSRGGLVTSLMAATLGNLYDYTIGEQREAGLGRELLVSTGIDFAIGVGVGLTAAAIVVGATALVGLSLPVVGFVAAVAIAGVAIGAAVEATGLPAYLKSHVGPGIDAWPGIFRNSQTIVDELGSRAGDSPPGSGGRRRK